MCFAAHLLAGPMKPDVRHMCPLPTSLMGHHFVQSTEVVPLISLHGDFTFVAAFIFPLDPLWYTRFLDPHALPSCGGRQYAQVRLTYWHDSTGTHRSWLLLWVMTIP